MHLVLKEGCIEFELVDKDGVYHGKQRFETSGTIETDLFLDGSSLHLVSKITYCKARQFLLGGIDFKLAINARAQAIGYDQTKGSLY